MLPGLILYEIIMPAYIMYILYKNRNHLDSYRVKFCYGYIYYEYKQSAYYWELVKIFYRMFLFFIVSFFEHDVLTKGALILALLELYLIVCHKVKPYFSLTLTKLDLYSTLINFVSILLTMILS